jgi:serine/threonine-protein kinase
MSNEGSAISPSQFGRYALIERLAIGGMAEVFRAKIVASHGFEKVLVIKRILPHLAADRTFVSMFIDEAKLTAQLTHPKIVQILDFGDVAGQYFIALEFVDGFDALALLRTCAQRRVRLPLHLAVFVVMEVLEALDYAHNARDMEGRPMRLVHRDISPSNIFISKRGDVKLGDFGIAHAQERESKTQVGTLKGKYGYMAPEQVVGGKLDGRSDLFALGIVLAEMLMGRRLFTAPNDLDVLLMVRDGRLDRLDKYASDLPPALDKIVRRSLRRDPAERYQTATELREALADYLFAAGKRVGAADLRAFVAELFPDGALPPPRERKHSGPFGVAQISAASTGDGAAARAAADDAAPAAPLRSAPPAAAAAAASQQASALGEALALPLAVVDLDQWVAEPARGFGGAPVPDPILDGGGSGGGRGSGRSGAPITTIDVGRFIPATPNRPPDSAGDVGVISPMRIFAELAVAGETGLLRFESDGQVKEIYLANGAPESVSSSLAGERFGEYLVATGVLRQADLDRALAMLPRYAGKLGDTLVGLRLMKPLDVFRMLSQQVRDRVIEVFGWTRGTFAFFRGVINQHESFPLGLDTFEILGAGVLQLSRERLDGVFATLLDFRPAATGRTHIAPEHFRLGPTPGEVLGLLDGERTLRDWMAQLSTGAELLTFLRSVYLLVETDLAQFD